MTLRYKFVLPVNVLLVLVLGASLAWEWQRQESTGLALLHARLDEEARFVRAAYRLFGVTPRFAAFLRDFCHASDAAASPEHQVALLDEGGRVLASAAEHARRPMDPARLAAAGDRFWPRRVFNLVLNSLEVMPHGGVLEVEIRSPRCGLVEF